MHIVWFKRDLRIHDHAALYEASKRGHVLPLYIIEPALWQQPDMSHRQYAFLRECLNELNEELTALGQPLIIRVGDAVSVLESLRKEYKVECLWSHQETWNDWTYTRDKRVKAWSKSHGVPWHEPVQYGVMRCLDDRDGWAARWYGQMKQPTIPKPQRLAAINVATQILPSAHELGLIDDECTKRQQGGRRAGLDILSSFLHERGKGYTKEMSSPVTAYESCSRLSPHLAFGTLSMREVFQASQQHTLALKALPRGEKGKWPSAMQSFSGRLRWHCHFMQKLEDDPRIEFENMHFAYNGLRENDFNQEYFNAWKTGHTGYPMVDACMRALIATGWLNFRMRAMLMSFASYHLWLHWREPALHLARLFTDYEPGIHYSQTQMQSGTTGINSIRIYNPIKQGIDHDPEGVFIRKWIPELADMPVADIHTPWKMPSFMNGYPMPIVDEKIARKAAADRLYGLRKNNSQHKQEAHAIVAKHGSRKSGLPRTVDRRPAQKKSPSQGELPL